MKKKVKEIIIKKIIAIQELKFALSWKKTEALAAGISYNHPELY